MIHLTGLTNAMTDIIVDASDVEIREMGLKKGFYNPKADFDYQRFLEFVAAKGKMECPGGSPFNVVCNLSRLGLNTVLLGTVGDDKRGHDYIEYAKARRIGSLVSKAAGSSGICYLMATPDGEKTSVVVRGVMGEYNYDLSEVRQTRFFHTSGYEYMTNTEKTEETLDYMKKLCAVVSFDIGDPEVVRKRRQGLEKVIEKSDVLFITEKEAAELVGNSYPEKELSGMCRTVVLKKGSDGSVVMRGNENYFIPPFNGRVVNTIGAGDAFAAGFLFGEIRNYGLQECGYLGSYIASLVCRKAGAHL